MILNFLNSKRFNMGYLLYNIETTLDYASSKGLQQQSKELAVEQLIRIYKKYSKLVLNQKEKLKYGYELELHMIERDEKNPEKFNACYDTQYLVGKKGPLFEICPECGAWQLEIIPLSPMEGFTHAGDLFNSLRCFFKNVYAFTKPGMEILSLPFLPLMGTRQFREDLEMEGKSKEEIVEGNIYSRSEMISDEITRQHPRYLTITRTVRERRGENPKILAPLYKDKKTQMDEPHQDEIEAGYVHLDALVFGMGLCCLQNTFACETMEKARWAYDQLHTWSPIMVRNLFSLLF